MEGVSCFRNGSFFVPDTLATETPGLHVKQIVKDQSGNIWMAVSDGANPVQPGSSNPFQSKRWIAHAELHRADSRC